MSSPADQPTGQGTGHPSVASSPMSMPSRVDVTDRIAEQVATLDALSDLPLAEHADVYQRVHVELQRALAEIDGA